MKAENQCFGLTTRALLDEVDRRHDGVREECRYLSGIRTEAVKASEELQKKLDRANALIIEFSNKLMTWDEEVAALKKKLAGYQAAPKP